MVYRGGAGVRIAETALYERLASRAYLKLFGEKARSVTYSVTIIRKFRDFSTEDLL